jgi:hypothetical protein
MQKQACSIILQGAAAVAEWSAAEQRLAASLDAIRNRRTPHGMAEAAVQTLCLPTRTFHVPYPLLQLVPCQQLHFPAMLSSRWCIAAGGAAAFGWQQPEQRR